MPCADVQFQVVPPFPSKVTGKCTSNTLINLFISHHFQVSFKGRQLKVVTYSLLEMYEEIERIFQKGQICTYYLTLHKVVKIHVVLTI